jgi:outer membrane protein TolC
LRLLNEEAQVDYRAVADAKLTLQLVTNQYDSGTVDISSILLAQINAYSVEQTAADVNFVRMTSAVALITALGGGWDVSEIAKAGVVDQTEP